MQGERHDLLLERCNGRRFRAAGEAFPRRSLTYVFGGGAVFSGAGEPGLSSGAPTVLGVSAIYLILKCVVENSIDKLSCGVFQNKININVVLS